jgi:predicted CoA-binding protein
MSQVVAILGASDKPERYSFKAFHMLKEFGHSPLPVTPKFTSFEGVAAYARLSDIKVPVDTLTMYVGPEISSKAQAEILALGPKRVIFNPGSENPPLQAALTNAGIDVEEACTLVLLRTGQF